MVDPPWVEELQQWKWCAVFLRRKYYAYRYVSVNGKRYGIPMARQILGLDRSDSRVGDHIGRKNTLDNRAVNLRPLTVYENLVNRGANCDSETGVKGVFPEKRKGVRTGRFIAKIKYKGVMYYLGVCDTLEEGRALYNAAAIRFHGEIAQAA
jgi:hypothetical protein